MAATVNVGAGMSSALANVSGSSLTENFDATFALAADDPALARRSRRKSSIATRRGRRTGLVQQRTIPGFLASEMFARVVYGNHPASRVSMTRRECSTRPRAMLLVAFHGRTTCPTTRSLAIAGDISMAEARKLVDAKLGEWKKRRHAGADRSTDPPALGPAKVYFIARPNSVQTSLWIGTQAISRTSPDYDVADGDERGHRRRSDRPAVHRPARGEGLHLRRVQQHLRASIPRELGGVAGRPHGSHRAGAPGSDRRNRAHARRSRCPRRSSRTRSAAWSRRSPCRSSRRARCSTTTRRAGIYKLPADYWDKHAGADRRGDAGGRAGRSEEVPRPRPAADRRRRRSDEGRRRSSSSSVPSRPTTRTANGSSSS